MKYSPKSLVVWVKQSPSRIVAALAIVAVIPLVAIAWLWGVLALLWLTVLPGATLLSIAWLLFPPVVMLLHFKGKLPRRWTLGALVMVIVIGTVVIRVLWGLMEPSNEGNWLTAHSRPPTAEFEGHFVTVSNVRDFRWTGTSDAEARWETRTYDLREMKSVEMVIVPFTWESQAMAHTFLTFGFENGDYISVSVEIRYREGDRYSPLKGLFRQYTVFYVIGDERDVIGLRTNIRSEPVQIYPLEVPPAMTQAVFVMMLQRANRLATNPEFYNTITNNCATNMVEHLEDLYQGHIGFDVRVLLPGRVDELAAALGLIEIKGDIESAREAHLVNDHQLVIGDLTGPEWSRQIRESSP